MYWPARILRLQLLVMEVDVMGNYINVEYQMNDQIQLQRDNDYIRIDISENTNNMNHITYGSVPIRKSYSIHCCDYTLHCTLRVMMHYHLMNIGARL